MITNTEAVEQTNFFRWAEFAKCKRPELSLLFHVPNGGSRNKAEAANLKMQGVKSGVPDIFLPVPRGAHHGLFIEMKVGSNRPTANQKQWIEELKRQGYFVAVCYGWVDAREITERYLNAK